jgi:5-(carboxyamino)imidazole ribonucleotide synthase
MEFYQNLKFGILGGGQLGRMLIQAGLDLNLQPAVLDPDPDAPCAPFTRQFTIGSLTDFDSVYNFGKGKDLLTIEIENVNTEALLKLQKEGVKIFPQPEVIKVIQDKRLQKQFYKKHGIPTADFRLIKDKEDLKNHIDFLPAFQKLGRSGYDGKGIQKINTKEDIEKGFEGESVLEKLVDYDKELSVIIARNEDGEVITFPVVEMVFHPEEHLVEYLFSPATITVKQAEEAKTIALKVIESLGMCGLLAVEMFLTKDGKILVNEAAPRPHNSGHQTIKGNATSQYEQHLRAILNLPLGSTQQLRPAALVNLLGEPGFNGLARYEGIREVIEKSGVHVHLYGKKFTKPFRKMGHVTILEDTVEALKIKAKYVKHQLKVKA